MQSRRRGSADNIQWQDSWLKRAKPQGSAAGSFPKALSGAAMQYSTTYAPSRGLSELLDSYRGSAWLQAVVNRIGYHFAVVPWQLHERPDQSRPGKRMQARKYQTLRGNYRHKNIANALRLGELNEIEQHPLLELLNSPNPQMGGVAFRDLCCKFVDFTGECFQLVTRDGLGIPYQLWPLSPTWIFRIPSPDRPFYDLSVMGRSMTVPAEDVIYIRRHELLNPFARGTGIGVSLGDTIDMDAYAHKFLKSFFFNGARPDMIIALPGATEDVIADFQQKFENQTRGPLRAHRTFFADDDIKVTELKNDIGATQSLPLLDHIRDTFISVYGVPPEIMGVLENANRATINQAMTIFARETLMPRLELFADEWQRQLVPLFDDRLLLSYTNPVPEDDDFKLDVARAAPWSLSAREWRQLGGWNTKDSDFNFHMVPMGLTATDDPAKPVFAPGQPGAPLTPPAKVDAAGSVPRRKGPGDGDPEDIADDVLRAFAPDYLVDELDPVWQAGVQEWGSKTLEELGIEAAFDIQNPRVKRHLREFAAERVKGINGTTQDALRRQLVEGFQKGENYRDIASRVKSTMATNDTRAETIARTEVMRSSNFASFEGYKQSGAVARKQWIATVSDSRTRDEHSALQGKVVGIDEDFTIAGSAAPYPGDFGDPALDINCRCTVAPVVDEPKSFDLLGGIWKAYDVKTKAWESQTQAAVLRAWAKQQRHILHALYALFSD
jgi:HK97 family phage portal protein